MDESLFIFCLVTFFVCIAAVIYCFLSTCLGLQIRRSDLWEAIFTNHTYRSPGHQGLRNRQHSYDIVDDVVWDYDHRSPMENIEMMSPPGARY